MWLNLIDKSSMRKCDLHRHDHQHTNKVGGVAIYVRSCYSAPVLFFAHSQDYLNILPFLYLLLNIVWWLIWCIAGYIHAISPVFQFYCSAFTHLSALFSSWWFQRGNESLEHWVWPSGTYSYLYATPTSNINTQALTQAFSARHLSTSKLSTESLTTAITHAFDLVAPLHPVRWRFQL